MRPPDEDVLMWAREVLEYQREGIFWVVRTTETNNGIKVEGRSVADIRRDILLSLLKSTFELSWLDIIQMLFIPRRQVGNERD